MLNLRVIKDMYIGLLYKLCAETRNLLAYLKIFVRQVWNTYLLQDFWTILLNLRLCWLIVKKTCCIWCYLKDSSAIGLLVSLQLHPKDSILIVHIADYFELLLYYS